MREIRVTSAGEQLFRVSLEGEIWGFRVRWNKLMEMWFLDLNGPEGQTVRGIPLTLGTNLLNQYGLGLGALAVADVSRRGQEAGATDLGERVILLTLSEEEYADIISA